MSGSTRGDTVTQPARAQVIERERTFAISSSSKNSNAKRALQMLKFACCRRGVFLEFSCLGRRRRAREGKEDRRISSRINPPSSRPSRTRASQRWVLHHDVASACGQGHSPLALALPSSRPQASESVPSASPSPQSTSHAFAASPWLIGMLLR